MPVGTGAGIGIGIGEALGEIGDTLRQRRENQHADIEKRADAIHQQAHDYAMNRLLPTLERRGYRFDPATRQVLDLKTGLPAQSVDPEAQSAVNEYLGMFDKYKQLFPPNNPNAMMQHFRRWLGQPQATPKANPQAEEITPGSVIGEVPPEKYTGAAGDFIQLAKLAADPSQPEDVRAAARAQLKQSNPEWQPTKMAPFVVDKDPNRRPGVYQQKVNAKGQTATELMPGVPASAIGPKSKFTDTQIAASAKAYQDWGVKPAAALAPAVAEYMQDNGMTPLDTKKGFRAFTKGSDGRTVSVLIDPKTNQPIPGTENPNILPPPGLEGRISTGFYHWTDENGQVHETQETRFTGPAGSQITAPGGGTSSVTPGPKQTDVKKPPPSSAGESKDRILGAGKRTGATQNKVDQAKWVLQAGQNLIDQINAHRDLIGSYKGRIGGAEIYLGVEAPELKQLETDMKSFAALQPALHGSRGVGMQKEFEATSARLTDNPDAAIAAVQSLMNQAQNLLSSQGDKSDMVDAQIPGQPKSQIHRSQIDAFKKKYPNATVFE